MALTTLSSLKRWMNITTTTDDDILNRMIIAASSFINSWLNRTIELQSYDEYYDGSDKIAIFTRNYPVTTVTAVYVNGVSKTILSPSDFSSSGVKFDDESIFGQNLTFDKGKQNVRIVYSAGYFNIPYDIEQSCLEMISVKFKNGRGSRLGVSSEALAQQSVSFFQGDMPKSAETTLMQWRNVVPMK